MVDMRVRNQDLLRLEPVLFEPRKDFHRIVARIDDDRFSRLFIPDDRAVALQPADRKGFDDHRTSCAPSTFNVPTFAAPRLLKSELPIIFSSPGGSFWLTTSLSFSRNFPCPSMYVASS